MFCIVGVQHRQSLYKHQTRNHQDGDERVGLSLYLRAGLLFSGTETEGPNNLPNITIKQSSNGAGHTSTLAMQPQAYDFTHSNILYLVLIFLGKRK